MGIRSDRLAVVVVERPGEPRLRAARIDCIVSDTNGTVQCHSYLTSDFYFLAEAGHEIPLWTEPRTSWCLIVFLCDAVVLTSRHIQHHVVDQEFRAARQ